MKNIEVSQYVPGKLIVGHTLNRQLQSRRHTSWPLTVAIERAHRCHRADTGQTTANVESTRWNSWGMERLDKAYDCQNSKVEAIEVEFGRILAEGDVMSRQAR